MKIRFYLFLLLILLFSTGAAAQDGAVKGVVISRSSKVFLVDVKVTLHPTGMTTYTSHQSGEFEFKGLEDGTYTITVSPEGEFLPTQRSARIEDGGVVDLGAINVADRHRAEIDDFEFGSFDPEDGVESSSMGVLLSASKDIFDNVAGFKFGQMRFRPRGYSQETAGVYFNGIYFNDANSGFSPWSLWSGLNDATRNQEYFSGAEMHNYGVGGINGTTQINARASEVRKGYRFSFVNASSMYRFRVMASYGSGLLDNGWSYALSFSTRQGGNDWVKGVYYNSWAYYGAVEKRFSSSHRLGLTFFATPGERASQGASTQEVYDMVGSNFYNPNWGYQGGTGVSDRRSARVRHTHEPVAILNYKFTPSDKFELEAAASFRFGRNGYTALDWYDAPDPRPDYYRYLPSYYNNPETSSHNPHSEEITEWGWEWNWGIRQIDWERLYWVNSKSDFSTVIDDLTDKDEWFWNDISKETISGARRSKYVIEERRTDQRDFNAMLKANLILSPTSKINFGYNFRYNRTENYKKIKDLLGGDYWLDVDNFADRDYPDKVQNNLDTPNRLVKKGDKYGYDYYAHIYQDRFWTTYQFNKGRWGVNAGLEVGHTRFWREGLYRKALFAENSKGKSEKQNFLTYTVKGSVSFMPMANQMIYLNFTNMQVAPYFRDAFLSPRTRNTAVSNLTNEKIMAVDLNYALRLPSLQLRLTGFYTEIRDKSKVISYYDDEQRVFSNLSMTGIDQQHAGLEVGLEVPIIAGISGRGVFSYGYYRYSNNPYVTMTRDNDESILLQDERVYWKDMKVEGTPQTALSLGLNYRGPHGIFAGIDANYFNAMYLGMSPVRRIDKSHVNLTPEQSQAMGRQEKLGSNWIVNANISKNWWFRSGYSLGVSLEVKNLLNDKQIKTGGYEQMRLRRNRPEGGAEYFTPFDSKYYYLYGTNYYLNVWFRF